MGVTNRLRYDPTDANSIAASSSIGAYVLAGTDGDAIGSETLNSLEWLRVAGPIIDSAGNEVGVTSNALDVNVAAASGLAIFAEDSAHTTADDGQHILAVRNDTPSALTSADGDYGSFTLDSNNRLWVSDDQAQALLTTIDGDTSSILTEIESLTHAEDAAHTTGDVGMMPFSLRVDDVTSVPAGNLAGTEGDYQAFQSGPNGELITTAFLRAADGTAITETAGALDVNIASGDVDDDLADTAIANTATAVSTTAVNVVSSALSGRKWLYLANEGNKSLYFGVTGVTASNGFPLHMGQQLEVRIGPSVTPQIIGGAGASSEDLRVMELS